jgi:hypothetical protein
VAGGLALIVVPGLLAVAWTMHADGIKAASPWTSWLTSAQLSEWNFGTMERRTNIGVWTAIGGRAAVLAVAWLLVVLAPWLLLARRRLPWTLLGALTVAVIAPPLTFINLYWVHDYYLVAVTPAIAMLVAILADAFVGRRTWRLGPIAAALVVAVVWNGPYWAIAYQGTVDRERVLPAAAQAQAVSSPDDVLIVQGRDWAAGVHYYAGRRGYAIPYDLHPGIIATLAEIPSAIVQGGDLDLLNLWPWVEALRPNHFSVATTEAGLKDSRPLFRVSNEPPAGVDDVTAWQSLPLTCGGAPRVLTVAPGGRLVVHAPNVGPGVTVRVAGLGALPLREWLQLNADSAGRGFTCGGADSTIELRWALLP